MNEKRQQREGKSKRMSLRPLTVEVEVCEPQHDCPLYVWDREHASMRVTGMHHAEAGLPSDIALLRLEGQMEVRTFLLTPCSLQPGTRVQVRVLGALQVASSSEKGENTLLIDSWHLIAVAEIAPAFSSYDTLEHVPPTRLAALRAYLQEHMKQEEIFQGHEDTGKLVSWDAEATARHLRETRLRLKRVQRSQKYGNGWMVQNKEERPVTWHALEGLSASLKAEVFKHDASDASAPHAQAERLIRFVPQRFQHALADLLLDDERLLAFIERPLLRHRTGLLGLQTWRSNEGLFLVTDRQVLWLRDFLSSGAGDIPGGYLAHSAPIERLRAVTLVQAGSVPRELRDQMEQNDSPYLHFVVEMESRDGSELFVVEFPQTAEVEKALARMVDLLRAFLPSSEGNEDRRMRRLPVIEVWQPQGKEAERLAGLGGIVPADVTRRLEQHLTETLSPSEEEVLVSALVPALEDTHTPARLVALTRNALLVIDDLNDKQQRLPEACKGLAPLMQRFRLATISSAQLRYSLFGSSLSLFVPQPDGHTQQMVIPFHSPAVAWFLPLFTRLRVALGGPW
ncbi:MAG: hypothetical protein NVSMB49_21360 [Ktedonobacteraceae bacterium]